ncbi:hypothetical protein PAMP_008977 [Pampus punctatissimus]
MPQTTQHFLIYVLLLWTTILTIIQVSFIILFYTSGHHGPPPAEDKRLLGKMLTFKAITDNKVVKWISVSQDSSLISDILTIKKDGYYFLTLQVTLSSAVSEELDQKVNLTWVYDGYTKVLLQGVINRNTRSTGLLGKVEELSAGGTLKVNFSKPTTNIDNNEYLTHLDVIYMLKH